MTSAEEIMVCALTKQLKESSDALSAAIKHKPRGVRMSNPVLDALAAQVAATLTVEASALALINGFAASVQAAVNAAIAGGVSATDLAPVQAEIDNLKASSVALAASVVANTPAAPPPPQTP